MYEQTIKDFYKFKELFSNEKTAEELVSMANRFDNYLLRSNKVSIDFRQAKIIKVEETENLILIREAEQRRIDEENLTNLLYFCNHGKFKNE